MSQSVKALAPDAECESERIANLLELAERQKEWINKCDEYVFLNTPPSDPDPVGKLIANAFRAAFGDGPIPPLGKHDANGYLPIELAFKFASIIEEYIQKEVLRRARWVRRAGWNAEAAQDDARSFARTILQERKDLDWEVGIKRLLGPAATMTKIWIDKVQTPVLEFVDNGCDGELWGLTPNAAVATLIESTAEEEYALIEKFKSRHRLPNQWIRMETLAKRFKMSVRALRDVLNHGNKYPGKRQIILAAARRLKDLR